MLSTNTPTAHLGIYNTLADWEVGHLLVELRTGRYTGTSWNIVTVAESREPITTMGGLHVLQGQLTIGKLLVGTCGTPEVGERSRRPRGGSWTPVFLWRRSVVLPRACPEQACSTGAITPAPPPVL